LRDEKKILEVNRFDFQYPSKLSALIRLNQLYTLFLVEKFDTLKKLRRFTQVQSLGEI